MIPAWRFFHVRVAAVERLSPTFVRITFTGDDLDLFADNGLDQRFKVVLPLPDLGFSTMPTGPNWYAAWRSLPVEQRNPIRTYTVRAVRPALREVDVDFALHGDIGPASRWASAATVGDQAGFIGPDARHDGPHGGIEYSRCEGPVLLAGDETAAPAILSILPTVVRATVLLEVPCESDVLPSPAPDGVCVRWLARGGAPHGSLLVPAVRAVSSSSFDSAWIAGEAGVVRTLRRTLIDVHGLARESITFMGYWRHNHPES